MTSPRPSPRESGANLFRQVYDLGGDPASAAGPNQRPVPRLCSLVLTEGFANQAREIRLDESEAAAGGVEFLIGEEWRQVMKVPVQAHRHMVNRFKVMANLDIGRVPEQLGQIHVRLNGALHILGITIQAQPAGNERVVVRLP